MPAPLPNITGGAATAGNIESATDARFAPVNIAGLFGSSITAGTSNNNLMPLIIGAAIVAALFLFKK